ncbi:MAG: PEP-CTERM system histidine kinase PrsK [Bacteroidales bacterium]|nr:PEP-CTERM system histidine kinase PrsK [Candidatus Latescibacterota bacterium]
MIRLPSTFSLAASGMLLLSVLTASVRGRFSTQKVFYILSALMMSSIMLAQGLLIRSSSPDIALSEFRIMIGLMMIFPTFGIPFFFFFARSIDRESTRKRMPGIITLGLLLGLLALFLPARMIIKEISFTEEMLFWSVTITGAGKTLGMIFIIANVFFLYGIENTYRTANVPAKVTLKYPTLGIFTASLINLFVIGKALSLSIVDLQSMVLETCGMMLVAASFLYADLRYPLFDIRTRMRSENSSVLSVIVAGLYILSIALVYYISALAGLSFDRSGFYVAGVFAIFLLAATLMSGNARRRLRRFMNDNFLVGRYNYRKEWRHYATLMASSSSVNDLASNTISSLCETVMVRKGIIWFDIENERPSTYGLTSDNWSEEEARSLFENRPDGEMVILGRRNHELKRLLQLEENNRRSGLATWVEAVAFLRHGEECRGVIALGRKDMGRSYTEEDRDFLTSVSDQATITLENLLMEEKILESSQIESFNRFASFVIHDLKNTVGMLSLTAENAKDNIDDKEFQKDTIDTINRSVDKMRALIDSLNAHKSPGTIVRKKTDISSVIRGKLSAISNVALARDIEIRFDCPKAQIAEIDPSALERIVENLVLNSIESTPPGGEIDLDTRVDDEGVLFIDVTDTGPGFDPGYLETSLFKPFSSTKQNGLGIGLVLCRGLVEAHGGKISAGNIPGNGARVSVILPPSNEPDRFVPGNR